MAKPLILVVDDDAPIVMLMRSVLREFGFEPVTATSGSEAVDTARKNPPQLVLLDKNMPGMTGAEVIRAFRAEPLLAPIPILILSGEPVDSEELAQLGANGAVQKPFDLVALVSQIREYTATAD